MESQSKIFGESLDSDIGHVRKVVRDRLRYMRDKVA